MSPLKAPLLSFFVKILILIMLLAYLVQGMLTQVQPTTSNEEEIIIVSDVDKTEQAQAVEKEIPSEPSPAPSTPTSPASTTAQDAPRKDPVSTSARRVLGKVQAAKKKVMNATNETTSKFLTTVFGWFYHVYVPEHGFWSNVWHMVTSQPFTTEVVLPTVFVFWLTLPFPYLYYAGGPLWAKGLFLIIYGTVNYNTIRSAGAFSHRVPEIEFGNFSSTDSYAESTLISILVHVSPCPVLHLPRLLANRLLNVPADSTSSFDSPQTTGSGLWFDVPRHSHCSLDTVRYYWSWLSSVGSLFHLLDCHPRFLQCDQIQHRQLGLRW